MTTTPSLRDVGFQAEWSVSSSKPGQGVDCLRDDDVVNTFWQSDGAQPHFVNIRFSKRTPVARVSIYVNLSLDDSYTPSKISIRAGTHQHDLQEVCVRELVDPKGWQDFDLGASDDSGEGEAEADESVGALKVFLIQVAVLSNHMNGKDTHIRSIKVLAPKGQDLPLIASPSQPLPFTSEVMQMQSSIR